MANNGSQQQTARKPEDKPMEIPLRQPDSATDETYGCNLREDNPGGDALHAALNIDSFIPLGHFNPCAAMR